MSDETTRGVCMHCGEPTDAGHHVGGYCYCGDRLNQWLLIEAEPSPAPPAEDDLTQLYEEAKRNGAGTYSGSHIIPLIEALTAAREERDRAREALREHHEMAISEDQAYQGSDMYIKTLAALTEPSRRARKRVRCER